MAHGKETPRQKMIGMMYLVLTAMLAMNVSADLLNAFVLVDSGLSQTTRNYASKNEKTFSRFTEAEVLNPQKVGPWKVKAEAVHKQSQELYNFIKQLKSTIVEKAEGASSPAILADGEVDGSLVQNSANTDIPGQVMILEGNGRALKEKLEAYRTTMLDMLDKEADKELYMGISNMLSTDAPPPTKDGIEHSWESFRFEHIPLIATLPQLTKVQVDVLNAEADIMNFLLNRIDAGDFKFNRIGSVVIPSSDYVMRGGEFNAQVFLAASDTTQRPRIYVGPYDSVKNEKTGEWVYTMRAGHENDTIPVAENGRGIYRRPASSNGLQSWGGLIEITGPSGEVTRMPFRHSYTVAEPSFAVSATKMNVLYLGVPNPIEVSVSGVSSDKVAVSMSGGTLTRSGNGYVARPTGRPGSNVQITVSAMDGATRKTMGSKVFRVKKVPDPVPNIFGLSPDQNAVPKARLLSAQGLEAKMPDGFDFDMKFTVLSFKVSATVGGYVVEKSSTSMQFTSAMKDLMRNLNPGMQVIIDDIKVKGPDGIVRRLQPKVLKVQ